DGKSSGKRKKRGRFDEGSRKETSDTRTMGACLRCHNQRVRCVPNKQDSKNPFAPCETCLRVRRDTRKTIHNIPCFRFKVTSMVVYRPGGLGLTKRFSHTKVADVPGTSAIYDIEVEQGLCRRPLRLQVRYFQPQETDRMDWMYMDNGKHMTKQTGSFCLADVEKTARYFNRYLDENCLDGLEQAAEGSDETVGDVFMMIARYCRPRSQGIVKIPSNKATGQGGKHSAGKDVLHKVARLWFAIRHGTGTAWLSGQEHLGSDHPLHKRTIVSRMIVAQFDSIRHERVYKRSAPEVLRTVDTLLTSCNKEAWFTVFLATFLLLHQVAKTSEDRYRHAQQNSGGKALDTRYGNPHDPLTSFVEELHHGAVMLLAHWHYFKRCDLMNLDWENAGDSPLMFLEPQQVDFIKGIVECVKNKLPHIPATPEEGCWEHELFWVSKMFVSEPSRKAHWTPPEMFTLVNPSVGRIPVKSERRGADMDSVVLVGAATCVE
ncbi:hypothetical protein N658DRAFT_428222, partial [Parathielavia hyrcaniae]